MYRQVYYHIQTEDQSRMYNVETQQGIIGHQIQTEGPIKNVQSRDTAMDHWTPDTNRRQTKQRKLKKIRYTNYEYIH